MNPTGGSFRPEIHTTYANSAATSAVSDGTHSAGTPIRWDPGAHAACDAEIARLRQALADKDGELTILQGKVTQ